MSSKKVKFGIGASILGLGVGLGYLAKKKCDTMLKTATDEIVYSYVVQYPHVAESLKDLKASEIMDIYLAIEEVKELDGFDSTIPLHILLGNVEEAMTVDETVDFTAVKEALNVLINFEAKLIARENLISRYMAKTESDFSKFMNEPVPFGSAYDSDFEDEYNKEEEPADELKEVSEEYEVQIDLDLDEDTAFKEPTKEAEKEEPKAEEEAPVEEAPVEEKVEETSEAEEPKAEEEKPAEK